MKTFELERETQQTPDPQAAAPAPAPRRTYTEAEYLYGKIGVAVKLLRLNARLTQAALAQSAGLTIGTICNLERGKSESSCFTLASVERALGCRVGLLVKIAG